MPRLDKDTCVKEKVLQFGCQAESKSEARSDTERDQNVSFGKSILGDREEHQSEDREAGGLDDYC